jgi:hypothetical protein
MSEQTAEKRPKVPPADSGERARKALVVCGPLSALIYVGWAELAALQWDDYSRITNAISELSLPDAPAAGFLQPEEFIVYHVLVIAFGAGIWLSAQDSQALRVVGALQALAGATFPFWLLFGDDLAAHMVLSALAVLAWLGSMAFSAAALNRRFRVYSLISLAVVLVFNGLAAMYVSEAAAGEALGIIGLFERIAFSAYFLWVVVLTVILWRRRAGTEKPDPGVEPPVERSSIAA